MDNFIVGFGQTVNEYKINGVRYIVESRFEPIDFRHLSQNTRIDQRLEHVGALYNRRFRRFSNRAGTR